MTDTYWSTVATTVPVLALAAVIELRRSATNWSTRRRLPRLFDGIVATLQALVYVTTFTIALRALGGTEFVAWVPTAVTYALVAALVVLVVQPLVQTSVRGNRDLIGTFEAWALSLKMWRVARQLGLAIERQNDSLRSFERLRDHAVAGAATARQEEAAARTTLADEQARTRSVIEAHFGLGEELAAEELRGAIEYREAADEAVTALDGDVERTQEHLLFLEHMRTRAQRLSSITASGRPTRRHRKMADTTLAAMRQEGR